MTNTPTAPLDAEFSDVLAWAITGRSIHGTEMLRPVIERICRDALASTQGSQGREADGFAAGVEDRAREMLGDLVGPYFSSTTLRVATDWLKQEARITTRALTPVREAEAISTASEGTAIEAGEPPNGDDASRCREPDGRWTLNEVLAEMQAGRRCGSDRKH